MESQNPQVDKTQSTKLNKVVELTIPSTSHTLQLTKLLLCPTMERINCNIFVQQNIVQQLKITNYIR
jgi:hypothetical protein